MYSLQARMHFARTASVAINSISRYYFSNLKTLEGFLDKFRDMKAGKNTEEISYNQFQSLIIQSCQHWDFSTINHGQMHTLSNILKHYKANNIPVLFPLQKQFTKSLPNHKSLSFSDSLALFQLLAVDNIAETNFLAKTNEVLAEKYQQDPNKNERKIGAFAWNYTYFNLPDPKITEFITQALQSLFPELNTVNNRIDATHLARIAFYLSYYYKINQTLHEKILSRIEKMMEHDRVGFYKVLTDKAYLGYLWTWFHSIELYDKDLYQHYKEKVFKKIPFQFDNKIIKESKQTRFGVELQNFLPKFRIKQEELLGVYFVDFLIESNIVVEYNGKNHYINFSERETGKHWIRSRNIRDAGYKLIDIPYFEWNGLTTIEEKKQYVKKKFEEVQVEI